jgi:hypothetical protein
LVNQYIETFINGYKQPFSLLSFNLSTSEALAR